MPTRTKRTPVKKKTAKKSPPKKKSSPKRKDSESVEESSKSEESDIQYPEVYTELCDRDNPLTKDKAKELLGWQSESENIKFKSDDKVPWLLKDSNGVKIRCHNNVINRQLYPNNLESLKQEILRGKWKFNAEPIIIGRNGLILNGQHNLIALVLACQDWDLHPGKWIEWQKEPTIEKLVVFGVDESDDTVNTMDTCKPRTFSDVLYRSEFFNDIKPRDRKAISRICSYAVNTLWERLGAKDSFAPKQTHSEGLHFMQEHPRILQGAEHVWVENGADNAIGRYLSPGYAAGMLYLMGCSTTEPSKYISSPEELSLDWKNWDKAEEFFVLLASDSNDMKPLKLALINLLEREGGSRKERLALLTKSWLQWSDKGKITNLKLKYEIKDEVRILSEEPSVGGIDLISFTQED